MSKINFDEIVKTYNSSGKEKAIDFIRENCKISPRTVFDKISKNGYKYNTSTKKYEKNDITCDEIVPFMSIDELYGKGEKLNTEAVLVQAILKEKLLNMLKYVNIDFVNKEVSIHSKMLVEEGYKILDV